MTSTRYDFVIVGGGSAGCALANRPVGRPGQQGSGAGGGPQRFVCGTCSCTCPRHCPFRSEVGFYDWKYESEPEPLMHGRRIYHARGKVLGGSSSINGMIFQRGNPMDYERWGADPGMADWDFAHCLPYFNRMENCLAAAPDDPYRGHDGPLALERGPATNPLFEAFFAAGEQAGYPRTDDVNGYRQEGFAKFDRNIRNGRRLSAARAYLHPVMRRPNLDVVTRAFRRAGRVRRQASGRLSTTATGSAAPSVSTPARSSCAAVPSTARSCCSCRASEMPLICKRLASMSCMTCRASARTFRITSRCTSNTLASNRFPCRST